MNNKVKQISNNVYKEFHKRFSLGEQYIFINQRGEIEDQPACFYWQPRAVYNKILPLIMLIKEKYPNVNDNELYGRNGLVSLLVPYQKQYNDIKNNMTAYCNRINYEPLAVEDGSVDIDSLEEEGLSPGKILVYRQGSQPPAQIPPAVSLIASELIDSCEYINKEMLHIYKVFASILAKKRQKTNKNDKI